MKKVTETDCSIHEVRQGERAMKREKHAYTQK